MSEVVVEPFAAPEPAQLFAALRDRPGIFFLDSGLTASAGDAAYSFIGFEPFLTFRAVGSRITVVENGIMQETNGDPLAELRALLGRFRSNPHPELPFTGGAVGYFSYEAGSRWEIQSKHAPAEDRPDLELGFYDGALVYHHATKQWRAVANPMHWREAAAIIASFLAAVKDALTNIDSRSGEITTGTLAAEPVSTMPRPTYVEAVKRIKAYIASGDVYQVNLAHRLDTAWAGDPFELYARLRDQSPAPFASFLTLRDGHVISCSPERFLRLREGRVETRPIKGTRPRGRSPAEDQRLASELSVSEKERAELLMIVDLERNDLGRVCRPGSIEVDELYRLETHPTVFHLVATVTGELRPDSDVIDLLRAAFPGGSITGAPKIRAMQIIEELEPVPRHVYTGAIGYLGFDGGCDLAIAIRTIVVGGGRASFHVGAGIVWDSDPESEYEETLAKARAMRAALTGAPR